METMPRENDVVVIHKGKHINKTGVVLEVLSLKMLTIMLYQGDEVVNIRTSSVSIYR